GLQQPRPVRRRDRGHPAPRLTGAASPPPWYGCGATAFSATGRAAEGPDQGLRPTPPQADTRRTPCSASSVRQKLIGTTPGSTISSPSNNPRTCSAVRGVYGAPPVLR